MGAGALLLFGIQTVTTWCGCAPSTDVRSAADYAPDSALVGERPTGSQLSQAESREVQACAGLPAGPAGRSPPQTVQQLNAAQLPHQEDPTD